jgi:hypothetical protein
MASLPQFPATFSLPVFHTYAAEGVDVHRIISGILQAHDATYTVKADGHKASTSSSKCHDMGSRAYMTRVRFAGLQYSVVIWKIEGFLRCSIRLYSGHGNQVLVVIRKRRVCAVKFLVAGVSRANV